jgi:hypothetical protein
MIENKYAQQNNKGSLIGVVSHLKKALFLLLLFMSSLLLLSTFALPAVSATASLQISKVDHAIEVREGGLVVINDTIRLSATGEGGISLQNFSMGFPFQYSSNLDYGFAYETLNPDIRHNVDFDVGLGRIGFYGINVIFSSPVDISENKPYEFTVTFVFSNLVSQQSATLFNITSFPMYPSLVQDVATSNVMVTLPNKAIYQSSFPIDSAEILNHPKSPLENFTRESAWLLFSSDDFTLIEVNKIERQLAPDQWGNLFLADLYRITNKGTETLSELKVQLPQGAYSLSVRDASGDRPWLPTENGVIILLRNALNENEKATFTVAYQLPRENYVEKRGWHDFTLTLNSFEPFNWTIRKLTVAVILPEGAEFQSSSMSPDSVQKGAFQEVVTFVFLNATPFHDLNFDLTYSQLVFWASFRPTLWIGVLAAVVAAIALFWRAPRVPRVPTLPVPPKDIRRFVNIYEKKTGRLRELESIEKQALKGKISRRQYRVRKRTLENRISVASRDLAGLREKMSATGPRYADMMRQIEVAETRLMGVETDIRRLETRYRHGEISKPAYRRLLNEYNRRRDGAKTTIDGVLLRLREEIR